MARNTRLNYTTTILNNLDRLRCCHPRTRNAAAKELFASDFKDFMIEKYVNCATHNAQLNMDRAGRLHEA